MRTWNPLFVLMALTLLVTACTGTGTPSDSASATQTIASQGSEPSAPASAEPAFSDGDAVRMVVAYPAGGGYDVTTRLLAPCVQTALQDATGASVSVGVENIAGASGKIGAQAVFDSDPDENMVLMQAADILVPQQVIEDAEWNVADFTPISRFIKQTRVILIRQDLLPESAGFEDFVERSQSEPILLANTGLQTQTRLLKALLDANGTPFDYDVIEFETNAEAVGSMLRGEAEGWIVAADGGAREVDANPDDLRVLVNLSELDTENADQIAAGVSENVRGFFGPPGMDPATVQALDEAFRAASEDPACHDALVEAGNSDFYGDTQELADAVALLLEVYEEHASVLGQ